MIRNSRNANMLTETTSNSNHQKFGNMLQHSGPNDIDMEELSYRFSNGSESATPANFDVPDIPASTTSDNVSDVVDQPEETTPSWDNQTTSPLSKSPWTTFVNQPEETTGNYSYTGLMGSLVREEGHIYSLATLGDLLYTGSDSKNIRVWKNQKEFSGFKSNSGLVKAIVIAGERIFTGHQDGKIRLWKASGKNPSVHKRIGTLPTLKAYIKTSMNPSNYVEVRRNKNAVWIKHFDAISCLNLSEDKTLLYSASWDKTVKVWRVSDSKCLESVTVHDDAVNSVVSGFDGLVFTGSADGTVKVWRREKQGKGTKHFFSQILLKQDCAITALAVNPTATVLYGGSSDGLVNFWEREKLLSHGGVLRGHKLAVLCLATAGNMVFSGSADTTICVWRRDQVDGQHTCLSVLRGHSGPVKCLAVEEDREGTVRGRDSGAWIAYSGSLDKSVKIWRVSSEMTDVRAQRQKENGGFAVEQTEMLSSSRGIASHG